MKKIYVFAMAAVVMAACSDNVLEERVSENGNVAADALLQVRTRGADDATISYPVQVYVFQGEGDGAECKAVQTIGDAGQALNIALTEGTYSVYAVGGASSTDYTLPAKDEATTSTVIALKEGRALTDLMAASATATLVDGGTNTVTLGLQRKTMLIQDVTIKKVPTAATAVSVTIAPLWQSLTIGGTYSTAGQTATIALTKQDDNRTWKNTDPSSTGAGGEGTPGPESVFLLPPSSQPASVSVNITIGGATNTYTYSTSDQLEAGYKINIDGTYTEAVGVNLTGTITGATWLGERTISFNFDENGSSAAGTANSPASGGDEGPAAGNEGGDTPGSGNDSASGGTSESGGSAATGSIPAVGDTYQGCYVLAVADADDHADVTLLSPTELTGIYAGTTAAMEENIENALSTVTSGDISGWEVPTYDEAQLMYNAREAIGNLTAVTYFYHGASGYRAFKPSAATFGSSTASDATVLRPVATITLSKE